jgi:hypothetical protein
MCHCGALFGGAVLCVGSLNVMLCDVSYCGDGRSKRIDNEVFLKGQYMEVGIHTVGSFGTV